jgi:hypothetical protein
VLTIRPAPRRPRPHRAHRGQQPPDGARAARGAGQRRMRGTCTHSRTPLPLTLQSLSPPRLVHPRNKAVRTRHHEIQQILDETQSQTQRRRRNRVPG